VVSFSDGPDKYHHSCGRPTFPATNKHPYGDYEAQKQYETDPAENIAAMAIDFRVLYGRAGATPPIE
jgi:hypothetical protein